MNSSDAWTPERLSAQQRRDLLALLCRVAWASGGVTPGESARLAGIRQRIASVVVGAEELHAWVRVGPPEIEALLPHSAKQFFLDSALMLLSSEGHWDPQEMRVIRDLLTRCFEPPPARSAP